MKVDTSVDTLVDRGVHQQPPVFQGEIRLVDRVDTYTQKNYWGSKVAARPVAGRALAQQWGKGIHPIHADDKANDYSCLRVDPLSGGYPPLPWGERSRLYRRSRRSRVGPSPSGRVGGGAEPRCFPLQKKIQMGNPVFPNLPAFPPFPTFPRGPHDPQN